MNRFLHLLALILLLTVGSMPGQAADPGGTVLITGANRGIGLEMARQFSAKGYTVIGTARKPEEATELKALKVRVEQLDVTDAGSVEALAKTLDGVAIDTLVNNAGVGGQGVNKLAKVDFEKAAWTFEVNAFGPMRVTQVLMENLNAGAGKRVVHISSIMGSIENNKGGYYDYRASKAALNMFNKSLAAELGKQGYICVVMHPGWVKTRMGGAGAPVETEDSVAGIIAVVEGLSSEDNGRFLDYQGEELPW